MSHRSKEENGTANAAERRSVQMGWWPVGNQREKDMTFSSDSVVHRTPARL